MLRILVSPFVTAHLIDKEKRPEDCFLAFFRPFSTSSLSCKTFAVFLDCLLATYYQYSQQPSAAEYSYILA
jgi:hypothetical protein